MTHVGQKLAFGIGGFLSGLGGAHQVGDVNAETHNVAVRQLAFPNAQHPAITDPLNQVGRRLSVNGHALGHPGLNIASGFRVLPSQCPSANDVFKRVARLHHVGCLRVNLAVTLVAQHQAVLGVEQGKGIVQRLNRATQQLGVAQTLTLHMAARSDVLKRA